MLDERKTKLELMISALEKEDIGAAADAEDEEAEGEEETEGDDGSENVDEEGDNNGEDEASATVLRKQNDWCHLFVFYFNWIYFCGQCPG